MKTPIYVSHLTPQSLYHALLANQGIFPEAYLYPPQPVPLDRANSSDDVPLLHSRRPLLGATLLVALPSRCRLLALDTRRATLLDAHDRLLTRLVFGARRVDAEGQELACHRREAIAHLQVREYVVSSVEAVAHLVQVARLYHYYHHTLSGEFARCSLDPIMPGPMSDLKPELERASPALGLS